MKTYWYQNSFDDVNLTCCDSSERLEVGDKGPSLYAEAAGCMTRVTPSRITARRARWEEKEVQHVIYFPDEAKSYLEY